MPPPVSALTANVLRGLKPEPLWALFETLASIPRPSKNEGHVLAWLRAFAEARSLPWAQDAMGNLVIRKAGQGGGQNAPTVVIQGHVDMVCEKNNDVEHDFDCDGIKLMVDGDWVKACGTTLGADNGLGVCTALALLDADPSVKLPPLECLFTVDEEQGLTGASGLDPALLTGRIMLNLDTEDWGELFFGCAGGGDTVCTLPVVEQDTPAGLVAHKVVFRGLLGGHSGLNIADGRGNALVFAAHTAQHALQSVPGARLADLDGGDKRNAICREATATILVPSEQAHALTELVYQQRDDIMAQYGLLEKGMAVEVVPTAAPVASVLSPDTAHKLLSLVLLMPHGAWKMSHAVAGLVETSNNLASVHKRGASYVVTTSTRSFFGAGLEGLRDRIELLGHCMGAQVQRDVAYSGWAPNPDSKIVALARDVFAELLGTPPEVKAIHAGLECGILGERMGAGVDCVSYGPTIVGAHSPDEAVKISTVAPFYDATLRILERIADGHYK